MVEVKRYLVFATLGPALGGWKDFKGSFGSKRRRSRLQTTSLILKPRTGSAKNGICTNRPM